MTGDMGHPEPFPNGPRNRFELSTLRQEKASRRVWGFCHPETATKVSPWRRAASAFRPRAVATRSLPNDCCPSAPAAPAEQDALLPRALGQRLRSKVQSLCSQNPRDTRRRTRAAVAPQPQTTERRLLSDGRRGGGAGRAPHGSPMGDSRDTAVGARARAEPS